MSAEIIAIRREVCAHSCESKCAPFLSGRLDHADPCTACPRTGWILAWGTIGQCREGKPAVASRPFGLGDAVAAIAQPIARQIDRVAGTHIAGCGGCQARQAALNRLLPDLRNPTARPLPKPGNPA